MSRRVAYAALFVVVLPALLAAWAHRLDALIGLPLPPRALASPVTGLAVLAVGVALMLAATRDLWRFGHGLPASPFPPQRLVAEGAYRLVAHPIYVGAVCASVGASLAARSAAGLWVVSPALALAVVAWVMGYERDATRQRFGAAPRPMLALAPRTSEPPSVAERVSVYVLVLAPWLVVYESIESLGAHRGARTSLPVDVWSASAVGVVSLLVLAAPLVAPRRRDVREFGVSGLVATAVIIAFDLLAPVAIVPSFGVVWSCLAARVFASRMPRLRWVWWAAAGAVGAATAAAEVHPVADVLAGFAAYALVTQRRAIWEFLRAGAEGVANSWHEKTLGPVRLLNHGIYAGAGAALSLALSIRLAGAGYLAWFAAFVLGAVIGAGLWGQFVEGSSALLRPYGYFGAVIGGVTVALAAAASGADAWVLSCAFGVGSTLSSALGRFRCLIQGCCHGREAPASIGIRFTHPRSRVVRLSTLGGTPVHPTQLYAILSSLALACVLVRLWALAAPLSLIAGMYFLLTGLSRFVEEHFRGEPQTVVVAGLRLYQWFAIGFVVGGAALTCIRTAAAPAPQPFDVGTIPWLVAIAVVVYAAYGLDFPTSSRRFSRLT